MESQVKMYSERSDADADMVAVLRKDLAQAREREKSTAEYISQLEANAATSEQQIEKLAADVTRLALEVASRDKSYQQLEATLLQLETSNDVAPLIHELFEKDRHVADVETRLQRALAERDEITFDRDRLKAAGELESKAAAELRARLENGEPIKSDGLESDEETDSGIGSSSGFLMKGSAEPVEAQAALEAMD